MHEDWKEANFAFDEDVHLRPLVQIVEAASKFESQIEFLEGDTRANAKSILDMIEFAALIARNKSGTFKLKAKGPDSHIALEAILQYGCRRKSIGEKIVKGPAGSNAGSSSTQASETE